MEALETLALAGREVPAARVREPREVEPALDTLGIARGRPAVVLVGGAADLTDPQTVRPLLTELAALAERLGAAVVDGGTDAGIMRLMGEARASGAAVFPLVGVAAEGTVVLPGQQAGDTDRAPLDPNHSHFVLVPGSDWGDEVHWLGRVAAALAGEAPSATVLVDGGDVARRDVEASLEANRPVVVVAGTGRIADALAAREDSLAESELVLVASRSTAGERLAGLLVGGA